MTDSNIANARNAVDIIIPNGPDAAADVLSLPYDPKQPVEQSISSRKLGATAERDPVVEIFAMNDYVVYKRASGKRTPVSRRDAVLRIYSVVDMLYQEDGGALQDQMVYDEWPVEGTVKACCKSAEMMGQPYSKGMQEKTLRKLQHAVKTHKDRKFDVGGKGAIQSGLMGGQGII